MVLEEDRRSKKRRREEHLFARGGPYRVRVYPESQWVYEGNDVVLQCRYIYVNARVIISDYA